MKFKQFSLAIVLGLVMAGNISILPFINCTLIQSAYAGEPIPNKKEWKVEKKRIGLQDGIGKGFDMGDQFKKFTDDFTRAGQKVPTDYKVQLQSLTILEGRLIEYIGVVKKKEPNNQTALKYLNGVLETVKQKKAEIQAVMNPSLNKPVVFKTSEVSKIPSSLEPLMNDIRKGVIGKGILWVFKYSDSQSYANDWTFNAFKGNGMMFEKPPNTFAQINFAPVNMARITIKDIDNTQPYYRKFREYFFDTEYFLADTPKSQVFVAIVVADKLGIQGGNSKQPQIMLLLDSNEPRLLRGWFE
jgi:hypothetical protein